MPKCFAWLTLVEKSPLCESLTNSVPEKSKLELTPTDPSSRDSKECTKLFNNFGNNSKES